MTSPCFFLRLYKIFQTKTPAFDNKDHNFSQKILDFLQYSDSKNDLSDISKFIKLNYKKTNKIYELLKNKKIISS